MKQLNILMMIMIMINSENIAKYIYSAVLYTYNGDTIINKYIFNQYFYYKFTFDYYRRNIEKNCIINNTYEF